MGNFKVIIMRTTYSVAEIMVEADTEIEAKDKGFNVAFEELDDDDYETTNHEFEVEIGRVFKTQRLVFNYKDNDHTISFTPEDEDWWTSVMSEGIMFDVHYCEDEMTTFVYECVQKDDMSWAQEDEPAYKQDIKL